jgi:hypothetical protein
MIMNLHSISIASKLRVQKDGLHGSGPRRASGASSDSLFLFIHGGKPPNPRPRCARSSSRNKNSLHGRAPREPAEYQPSQWLLGVHTSFGPGRCRLACECSLFEWPPFEILLVSPTRNTPLMTLLTSRFRLVAFQSFRFASDASCRSSVHVRLCIAKIREIPTPIDVPLRLFDCFGFSAPSVFLIFFAGFGVVVAFRFAGGGRGFGTALITGELRNAVGDGIVMVSIFRASCKGTSAILVRENLGILSGRRCVGCVLTLSRAEKAQVAFWAFSVSGRQ